MFATHVIEPEEFVIEYIGEMIRLSLADTRERVYQVCHHTRSNISTPRGHRLAQWSSHLP